MRSKINSFGMLMALAAQSKGTGGRFANINGGLAVMNAIDDMPSTVYTGAGDPGLSITGSIQDFREEGHVNKRFGFTITNTSQTSLTARLFAGYNTGSNSAAPGQLTDGAFNDVTGAPGLVGTANDPRSRIAAFQQYVLRNPTRILVLRMSTQTPEQFQQEISVGRLDPFEQTGSQRINPSLGINGQTFNQNVVSVNTDGLQLDDRSDILYTLEPGASINIIMFCGASLEQSQALAVKAAIAQNNVAAAYNTARNLSLS